MIYLFLWPRLTKNPFNYFLKTPFHASRNVARWAFKRANCWNLSKWQFEQWNKWSICFSTHCSSESCSCLDHSSVNLPSPGVMWGDTPTSPQTWRDLEVTEVQKEKGRGRGGKGQTYAPRSTERPTPGDQSGATSCFMILVCFGEPMARGRVNHLCQLANCQLGEVRSWVESRHPWVSAARGQEPWIDAFYGQKRRETWVVGEVMHLHLPASVCVCVWFCFFTTT